jgi:hypothetical protein
LEFTSVVLWLPEIQPQAALKKNADCTWMARVPGQACMESSKMIRGFDSRHACERAAPAIKNH